MAGRPGGVMPVESFDGSAAEWDGFVARAGGGTHAHRLGWLEVIRATFGHQAFALCVRGDDRELAGVMPLVRVRTPLFGHYLVSVPFLSYGGPLGSEAAVLALAEHAREMGRADRVKLLELRSRIPLPLDLAVSHRKITVTMPLPAEKGQLWDALPSKLRSQVRRPGKEGVEVRVGADQVAGFHRVFAHHMRDLGTPALPRSFFENTIRVFGDDAWFAVAWLGMEPIAAGAGIRWNGESEIIWAAALRAHNRLAPNMAVYWAAMEHAVEGACRTFNFGRCTPGGGTHRFKQQWGGVDEQLNWYQFSPAGVSATPSPDAPGYGLAVRAWRRLPVPVATALGPWIVRGIP